MFGISHLGWIHTLGSLPAIPAAVYMFARYGRITPRSRAGTVYLISMLAGATTVFFVTHQPVSYAIAVATLFFLLVGYSAGRFSKAGGMAMYIETVFLTVSAFLLMVPTVTETLRRVPDGHPFVTDLKSPLLLGSQASLLVMLIVGLSIQIMYLRRKGKAAIA
ncbi:hypothetical protein [Herbaspirillum sp. RV1423]|uniref:hypothetical protein n=1 Tax=Herbaspirillum sp. RV1423 TaxID=1443993 RepID=UPI000555EEF8|nr:hypothetical protein [Herbaspirillum sp. RV1423]